MSVLRAALAHPVRPAATLRRLREEGGLLCFSLLVALLVCLLAGVRAGLLAGGLFSPVRFATSLSGFILLPMLLWLAGRPLGGRGQPPALGAATAGCAVPFVAVDALWIVHLAAGGAPGAPVPTAIERLSWLWALALLVAGVREAQRWRSPLRAAASVGMVALGLALLIGGAIALRAA